MNILLFDEADLAPDHQNQIVVRDRRAVHVREILKLGRGQTIRVGRLGGNAGVGELIEVSDTDVRIQFEDLCEPPPACSPVELILALPRPKSLKRTMRAVANLGIKSVHLINSSRVEKPYWTAAVLEPQAMRNTLLEGLEIARDTVLPTVRLHRLFKPFVQDSAPHLVERVAFVAHPGVHTTTRDTVETVDDLQAFENTSERIPVAIGPEGGFSDYEVGLFRDAGFQTLSLGDRIYSVECAVPVIEALVRSRLMKTTRPTAHSLLELGRMNSDMGARDL